MAEHAFQQAQTAETRAPARATQPRAAARTGAEPSRPLGNQARLRRMPTSAAASENVLRRSISSSSASGANEVAGHINSFCGNSAVGVGNDVKATPGACQTTAGPGCECACKAMLDDKRSYSIEPKACDVKMTKETMADKSTQTIPESSVWPNTAALPCGTPATITIPKAGSTMEFGAFDATGKPFWYSTWRILAHELCGHGVNCQTYSGDYGDRQEHDATIDTENTIAGAPARGHFKDPRQGESFANKAKDHSKVAFKLKDGWHFEAP